MIVSIELQVISKILTSNDDADIDTLCGYDSSYYSLFKPHIEYILNHRNKYGSVPDAFTFQAEYPDFNILSVKEPIEYLIEQLCRNKRRIMLVETFNKIKDLGENEVDLAWRYVISQGEKITTMNAMESLDVVHDSMGRSRQVVEYSKQARIPTGFPEIDKAMYGGMSTVEELLLLLARTNSGKSWVATRMMESAQRHGFPVLYYSPEMQGAFLGTRFDTWRGHFQNSQLHQGNYTEQYYEYLKKLQEEETSAFVLEDKDAPDGVVHVPLLKGFVKKHGIKLVIIDGLSYMEDASGSKGDSDYVKYKHLCADLFQMSKQCGCAVVVVMQANRATKDNKDDKGEVFPNIYNIEGSDHPARIATQVFAMRQIFDKHILDIRLEKSRNANNQKPEFSYAWDINTGNLEYIANAADIVGESSTPVVNVNLNVPDVAAQTANIDLDDSAEDVTF